MFDAASVLTRWGVSGESIAFDAIVHDCCDDPIDTLLDALEALRPDLVVAGTHQREGIARALFGSRAEAIAHNVSVPTLLLPVGRDGFVSRDRGVIDLGRVLVPIGDPEAGAAAIASAVALAQMAGARAVELVLLHVGESDQIPAVDVPRRAGWTVRMETVEDKSLEDAILSRAANMSLVVMATRGHDSVLDVLRGSHTDRVLHRAHCPVLSVPV
jgi:nucleotide-binding universal stress UspA family protein